MRPSVCYFFLSLWLSSFVFHMQGSRWYALRKVIVSSIDQLAMDDTVVYSVAYKNSFSSRAQVDTKAKHACFTQRLSQTPFVQKPVTSALVRQLELAASSRSPSQLDKQTSPMTLSPYCLCIRVVKVTNYAARNSVLYETAACS